jgi:CMP-N-acetylneuraminic acid synthetase
MSNRKKLILNKEKILELAEIFYENKNKFISILLEIANKNYINKSKAFFEAGNYLKNNKKYYVLSIEKYKGVRSSHLTFKLQSPKIILWPDH